MARTTQLRKVGGSVMLAIPKPVLEALDLGPDTPVGLSVRAGRLVVEPRARKRYSLGELLAQCRPRARHPKQDRAWTDGARAGREII